MKGMCRKAQMGFQAETSIPPGFHNKEKEENFALLL